MSRTPKDAGERVNEKVLAALSRALEDTESYPDPHNQAVAVIGHLDRQNVAVDRRWFRRVKLAPRKTESA